MMSLQHYTENPHMTTAGNIDYLLLCSVSSDFAPVTLFQSIFQRRQHHVHTLLPAVTAHQAHTQHLETPQTTRITHSHTPRSVNKLFYRQQSLCYHADRWPQPSRNLQIMCFHDVGCDLFPVVSMRSNDRGDCRQSGSLSGKK